MATGFSFGSRKAHVLPLENKKTLDLALPYFVHAFHEPSAVRCARRRSTSARRRRPCALHAPPAAIFPPRAVRPPRRRPRPHSAAATASRYASIQAIKSPTKADDQQWLI